MLFASGFGDGHKVCGQFVKPTYNAVFPSLFKSYRLFFSTNTSPSF